MLIKTLVTKSIISVLQNHFIKTIILLYKIKGYCFTDATYNINNNSCTEKNILNCKKF